VSEPDPAHEDGGGRSGRVSKARQAMWLVDELLAAGSLETWLSVVDREPYATLIDGGRRETTAIGGRSFGRYVRRLYYDAYDDLLHGEALTAVRAFCELRAEEGGTRDTFVRVAHDPGGDVLVDAGSSSWDCYRVRRDGWTLEPTHPVAFTRGATMAAFPTPVQGGRSS
jgi:hypothetical protein